MESNDSQQSRSTLTPSKPMGSHVKAYLEQWYGRLGKPKSISRSQKDSILRHIQSDVDPAGISASQLTKWLANRRRSDKVVAPQPKRLGTDILFPELTNTELERLNILVGENSDPSPALVAIWVESPLLPNLTIEDAHRFVKYNQALLRNEQSAVKPDSIVHQEDVAMDDASQSEEDELFDDHPQEDQRHLPTPSSTSPEPKPFILKPDTYVPSMNHLPTGSDSTPPPPLAPAAPLHLSHEARDLIKLLRSQLPPEEFQRLLQEEGNNVTSAPSTSLNPNVEPSDTTLPSSESHLRSPISPAQHRIPRQSREFPPPSCDKAVFLRDPIDTQTESDDSSGSHQIRTSRSSQTPVVDRMTSRGLFPKRILNELSDLICQASIGSSSPDPPQQRLDQCRKQSEELFQALEKGDLRVFGLLPSDELKALGLVEQAGPPVHTSGPLEPP